MLLGKLSELKVYHSRGARQALQNSKGPMLLAFQHCSDQVVIHA